MKYETPELTALTPAINAIQSIPTKHSGTTDSLHPNVNDGPGAGYQDWE